MSAVFLDSNVLVYCYTAGDPRMVHAQAIVAGGGVISAQCLNEFANVARRKLDMGWSEVHEAIDIITAFCRFVVPIDHALHRIGLRIAEEYRLSVYDGMIVAAARTAGCETLYSEDLHHGLVIDGVLTIMNPFRE